MSGGCNLSGSTGPQRRANIVNGDEARLLDGVLDAANVGRSWRGGASSGGRCCELSNSSKPAMTIPPLGAARGHDHYNARASRKAISQSTASQACDG